MALGFCIVPTLLLRAQRRLGLNPTQLAIIMQLCDYWWDKGRTPFPSKRTLAERLGISPRQLQRHLAELDKAGLVSRIERRNSVGAKLSNNYDLEGLVNRLNELAPEFRKADESAKATRQDVAIPGHRLRSGTEFPSRKN